MEGEISLLFRLELAMSEEKECEHSKHTSMPEFHGGSAEWFLVLHCPRCSDRCEYNCCDKWKITMMSGTGIYCSGSGGCGYGGNSSEFLVGLGRLEDER